MTDKKAQESGTSRETYFTRYIEDIFVEYALSDRELFVQGREGYAPEVFKYEDNQRIVKFIADYYDKHGDVPDRAQVQSSLGLERVGAPEYDRDALINKREWLYEQVGDFCRYKNVGNTMEELFNLHDAGDYDAMLPALEEALKKRAFVVDETRDLEKDGEWFSKILADDTENWFSTGWRSVDKRLGGGIQRGQMTIFVGGTGSGKSIMLGNTAINLARQGLKVLFVSVEMSLQEVTLRNAQMMTGKPRRPHMDPEERDAYERAVKAVKWRGNITVDFMEIATAAAIEAKLRYFHARGVDFDAVALDYIDECFPNNSKKHGAPLYERDNIVAKEMKALCQRRNLLFLSASQLNNNYKERKPGEVYEQYMIAGGQGKIRKVDNAIFLEKMDNSADVKKAEKEAAEDKDAHVEIPEDKVIGYRLFFTKTRHSGGARYIEMKWNADALRVIDPNYPVDSVYVNEGTDMDMGDKLKKVLGKGKHRRKGK